MRSRVARYVFGISSITGKNDSRREVIQPLIAGIGVALKPRVLAYIVAIWLLLIIINLLSIPGYYNIALRDLGLVLGALALGKLSYSA